MSEAAARQRIAFPRAELEPGGVRVVTVGRREIAVFDVNGAVYAIFNRCPHQQAPLAAGSVGGAALPSAPGELVWGRRGEILQCPWHHYAFDLTNGRCLFEDGRVRVATYEARVEDDEIAVYV